MKTIKLLIILVVIFAVLVVSAPLWGGCDFNQQLCEVWCETRHAGSDLKAVTCKASCATDKLSCLAK